MIIETQYLPSVLVFSGLLNKPELVLESCENYQKRSFRNRCYLAGSQGLIFLSIPLEKGKNEQLNIRKVKISYAETWIKQHLFTIQTNYGKSPYFIHYFDELKEILKTRHTFLFDLNKNLIEWSMRVLRINVTVELTEEYVNTYNESVLDWRNQLTIHIWNKPTPVDFPGYPQVFEDRNGFIPYLSILDLIFCQGPESIVYLRDLNHHLSLLL